MTAKYNQLFLFH